MHDDIAHLIIIGMIIDGHLSGIEKRSLNELAGIGVVDYNAAQVKAIMKEFLAGNGKKVLDEKLKMVV
jgi:hypothetical protein